METVDIRQQVTKLFFGGPRTTRIGIEHELIIADKATGLPVLIDTIRAATDHATYSRYRTFEPGGQVELSLPAASDPMSAANHLAESLSALRADCSAAGMQLLDEPVDRRSAHVPLQLKKPRYVAMQQRFDSIGPAGRQMMRRTASTQFCLDWWSGDAGISQWRLLNLAGPSLAAALARSTGPDSRLATWLTLDPTRTAFDDRLISSTDPVAAYIDFAVGAVPFTSPAEHLTTLFPPVRPRGNYLEVRFLDVQPINRVELIGSVLSNLMYDDRCHAHALDLVADDAGHLAERWEQAAHGDPELIARGSTLVDLALDRVLVA